MSHFGLFVFSKTFSFFVLAKFVSELSLSLSIFVFFDISDFRLSDKFADLFAGGT